MQLKKSTFIALMCSLSAFLANAQTSILPIASYGVWDRSNAFDISVDTAYSYLRGISADVDWKDVQSIDSNQFDFSAIAAVLQTASQNQQMVNISVGVGPDAPAWIYANGVLGVITDDTHRPFASGERKSFLTPEAKRPRRQRRVVDSPVAGCHGLQSRGSGLRPTAHRPFASGERKFSPAPRKNSPWPDPNSSHCASPDGQETPRKGSARTRKN